MKILHGHVTAGISFKVASDIIRPPCAGGGGLPASDKLLVYLNGTNATSSTKLDVINGYNFTFDTCPPDYWLSVDGSLELDVDGNPNWVVSVTDGWECTYYAPASGDPGYAQLTALAAALDMYAGGVPVGMTMTEWRALTNDQVFACNSKGILVYDQVLTGDDLAAAQLWEDNCTASERDDWYTDVDGEPYYDADGNIYTEVN